MTITAFALVFAEDTAAHPAGTVRTLSNDRAVIEHERELWERRGVAFDVVTLAGEWKPTHAERRAAPRLAVGAPDPDS